jgi:hypothetical protein
MIAPMMTIGRLTWASILAAKALQIALPHFAVRREVLLEARA